MTADKAKRYEEIRSHWKRWETDHYETLATNGFVRVASKTVCDSIQFLVGLVEDQEKELARLREDLDLRLAAAADLKKK